jgi:hypothetical protein
LLRLPLEFGVEGGGVPPALLLFAQFSVLRGYLGEKLLPTSQRPTGWLGYRQGVGRRLGCINVSRV